MTLKTSSDFDWLARWALYAPATIALQDGDTGRELSYGRFFQDAQTLAHALSEKYGIGHGDRVAVVAQNELEYITLFFALHRLGAILVPVNFRLTAREIEHIVSDCAPKLLVYQEEFATTLSAIETTSKIPKILLSGADSLASLAASTAEPFPFFAAEENDAAMILYTSGTTGSPKGAVLTHKQLFWNSVNTTLRLNVSQTDAAVIFLPLFHTGGWNVLTTPFLHRGAKIVLVKKFQADQILELCDSQKCTLLFGVPTTMDMLARSPRFESASLKTIRYAVVGGEPMPLELIKAWHAKGLAIRQGYGLTEFGPNVFSLNEADCIRKIGSIGFPNFYIQAKVIDDAGHELGAEEIGELVLKGPVHMKEYWNNPKATAETLVEGWLHTGDLVRRDSDGYYYVVGRKKDMYKSGGENVYPAEIEQVIGTFPGVREVAVIGVPDEKWGEVGKAFVVVKDVSMEQLQAFCLKNLAKFKIPRHFEFMAELPKGDSGKILKKALKAKEASPSLLQKHS